MSCLWVWCRRVHTTDSDTDREGQEERPSGDGEPVERRKKEKKRWRMGKWMKGWKQRKNNEEGEQKTEQKAVKVEDEAEDRDRSVGLESGSPSVSAETLESAGPPVLDPFTAQTDKDKTLLQDVAEKTQQLQSESTGENVMKTTVAEEAQAEATAELRSISLEIVQQEVQQSKTGDETIVVSELQDHQQLEALEKPLENLGSRTETVSELQKTQRKEEVPTVSIHLLGRKVNNNEHPDPPKDARVKDQPAGPSRPTGEAASHRGQRGNYPKSKRAPSKTPRPELQPDRQRNTQRQEGPRGMPPRHWQREQRTQEVAERGSGGQMYRRNWGDNQPRQNQQRTLSVTIWNTPQKERHQPQRVVTYHETQEFQHSTRDQRTDRGFSQRGSAQWRDDRRDCFDYGRNKGDDKGGQGRRGGHWRTQRHVWWQHDNRC